MIKLIKKKHGKDVSKDNKALGKLRRECERAKRACQHQVRVEIESLFDGVDFSEPLTRARFEELNDDLFRKTIMPLLKDYFNGKEPNKGVNPDEVVAYGVAIQGGILSGEGGNETKDILLLDVAPLTLELKLLVGCLRVKGVSQRIIGRLGNSIYLELFQLQDGSDIRDEEFAEEDRKVKEKIDARNILETYVYNMKNQVNDKDKLADKLQADEKEIETAVKEVVEWLDDNQSAKNEDYEEKLKEVEATCNPIIMTVYQRSGGAPVGACLDMITKRKQQREAVEAILNSSLISSKKTEPSTKSMFSKRPLQPLL
uniref:Uncharacterized protein n=1 Tax=Salix viminalis TaxID=40686 RepID=A0A6N2MKQ5_SALVM